MSRFLYGDGVPGPVRRVVELAERHLAGVAPDVVVVVGADDPGLARRLPPGPRVVVPAPTGRRASPWARELLSGAAATVLIDAAEAAVLRPALRAPVVVTGTPAPPAAGPGARLTAGEDADLLLALWRAEFGALPPGDGPGVTWATGPAALAGAAEAWARGDAVVLLPGTPRHDMLRAGGALAARSSLEVVEATRLLLGARALAHELARRGRGQLQRMASVEEVVGLFAEALALAEAA